MPHCAQEIRIQEMKSGAHSKELNNGLGIRIYVASKINLEIKNW